MNARLQSLLLALGALALFWMLFFPKPQQPGERVVPTSTERSPEGYLALWRWLSAAGTPVLSLHQRYDWLLSAPATRGGGNILLSTLPHSTAVSASEWPALQNWVRRGNTLIVMAALDDTPGWELAGGDGDVFTQLQRMTQLKFTEIAQKSKSTAADAATLVNEAIAPKKVRLIPSWTQSPFDGVSAIATVSELPASRFQITPQTDAPVIELARRADNADAVLWSSRDGDGLIMVSAYSSPFTNQAIGEADNARWLRNLVSTRLSAHGRFIFDDAHQGVVDYYDPAAFLADPRLHRTLWWIVLLWLVFVLGSQRLRPARVSARGLDDTAMLRVSAGFFANVLTPTAVARRLFEHFFNALRRRLSLREDGTPVWAWLERDARLPAPQLEQLKQLYQDAQLGRAQSLSTLQQLISRISRNLT